MQIHLIDTALIQVSDRQRTGLLETEDLAESIQRIGQLQPIIITKDYKLIAGERRLEACKSIRRMVEARFFEDLSPEETSIIELEENVKRKDLDWQDRINAVGKIHSLYQKIKPDWTVENTAKAIGMSGAQTSILLTVHENIDNPLVQKAAGFWAAYNVLTKASARRADSMFVQLIEETNEAFKEIIPTSLVAAPKTLSEPKIEINPESVIQANFLEWAPKYKGKKFNLIHCDFPYGIGVFDGPQGRMSQAGLYEDTPNLYFELIDCLLDNVEKLLTPSGHIIFWFSMQHYQSTIQRLAAKFWVNPYPLIWVKSDNAGIAPDPRRGPRQIYETALLAYRGERPIIKVVSNAIALPTEKSLHPSTKPEGVLKHFFTMLVDNTTRILDPTCGSGTALRAAEEMSAEFVYGMDIDAEHVDSASVALKKARIRRNIKP
jgi:ParB/RepB/Spo0J family partition protein